MPLADLLLELFAGDVALDMIESVRAVGLQLVLAPLGPEVVPVLADEHAPVSRPYLASPVVPVLLVDLPREVLPPRDIHAHVYLIYRLLLSLLVEVRNVAI